MPVPPLAIMPLVGSNDTPSSRAFLHESAQFLASSLSQSMTLNLGTPSAKRKIVLFVVTAGAGDQASVTLDDVAMTQRAHLHGDSTQLEHGLYTQLKPAGTSATLKITCDANNQYWLVRGYALHDVEVEAPAQVIATSLTDPSATLAVPRYGTVLAAAGYGVGTTSIATTWTNLAPDGSQALRAGSGSAFMASASQSYLNATNASVAVSASRNDRQATIFASWA